MSVPRRGFHTLGLPFTVRVRRSLEQEEAPISVYPPYWLFLLAEEQGSWCGGGIRQGTESSPR